MKKLIVTAIAAAMLISSLASCKPEYDIFFSIVKLNVIKSYIQNYLSFQEEL